ncbi:GTPase family protein [Pseudomonas putida]|uniref:GTPase family protein n=1 Tax=Pseudomonas putida TaxID=303 RepID=UPI0009020536|nr:GTPase [Pseudomonas putida]APE96598.1 GTP-binding protein HSR1 [Pseudomonas putida]
MYLDYKLSEFSGKINRMGVRPLDVMLAGSTGAGKSSTINALFSESVAKVGKGVDPETMDLDWYNVHDYLRVWDTPGLGDGFASDKQHSKKIIDLLYKTYSAEDMSFGFVDLALVIIDGSSRDLGTAYKLINEILIPNFQADRIVVAINQADVAMKGRHWNFFTNTPDDEAKNFLNEKALSVKNRVAEATGVNINIPVCYSADCGYNVSALMDALIKAVPDKKRAIKVA